MAGHTGVVRSGLQITCFFGFFRFVAIGAGGFFTLGVKDLVGVFVVIMVAGTTVDILFVSFRINGVGTLMAEMQRSVKINGRSG